MTSAGPTASLACLDYLQTNFSRRNQRQRAFNDVQTMPTVDVCMDEGPETLPTRTGDRINDKDFLLAQRCGA
jgi:hypothetical protein